MSSLTQQIDEIEQRLLRGRSIIPDLPVTEFLISRLLMHLGREMNARLDRNLRPFGLGENELRALMTLYVSPTITPGELCQSMHQSPANITRVTDILVERGLLLRLPDPQDRRRVVLQLTPQGTELFNTFLPTMLNAAHMNYAGFSSVELDQLLAALRRLAANMDRVSRDSASASDSHE